MKTSGVSHGTLITFRIPCKMFHVSRRGHGLLYVQLCAMIGRMFTHIKEVEPKQLTPGVQERLIIQPPDTTYGILTFKLLTLNLNAEIEISSDNKERIYYILDGRGTFSILWLKGRWHYPVRSDMSLWIPMLSHRILNRGDNELRCLVAECTNQLAIDDRDISVEVVDIRKKHEVSYTTGKEQTIVDPAKFQSFGSKFNLCAYATLFPGGATDLHVPTDRCEETGYVLRGSGEMVVGSSKEWVSAGSIGHVKAGTLHQELNTSDDLFEYFIVETHD